MSPTPTFPTDQLRVEAWDDPLVDRLGHDPRSTYTEHYWLGILGPSACWLLRRLADGPAAVRPPAAEGRRRPVAFFQPEDSDDPDSSGNKR